MADYLTPPEDRARSQRWKAANKNRVAAYNRKWRSDHPGYDKAYYDQNTEQAKLRYKRSYEKHRPYHLAKNRRFRQEHPGYGKDWERTHPIFVAAKNAARRCRTSVGAVDPQIVFKRDRWICQICHHRVDKALPSRHGFGPTLDHKIPLSKGGSHSYENCQLAHRSCNSAKGAKLPMTLLQSKAKESQTATT